MTRAALYARYSSDLQNERSAEDQLAALRIVAAARGLVVVEEFADRGISGSALANRPAARALLRLAEAGGVDLVLAEALDRLSRDQEDIAHIFKRLEFHGAALETLSEGRIGELHVGLSGTMNRMFLVELGKKTRRGVIACVLAGRSGGGRCYGYDIVGKGELTPNHAQAAVVREIFAAYVAGRSPRAIAHALNARGEPGPRGGTWTASAINGDRKAGDGILHNALYAGERVFNRRRFRKHPDTGRRSSVLNPPEAWVREPAPALRIVDDALWGQVQALKLGKYAKPGGHARRPRRLLSGLVRCSVCEGSMTLKGAKFVCSTRAERGPAVCSNGKVVDARALEARVLAGVRDALLTPAAIERAVRGFHDQLNAARADARAAAEIYRDLAETQRRIDRAADSYEAGVFDVAELARRVTPLKARRTDLEAERSALAAPDPVVRIHPGAAKIYRDLAEALGDGLQGDDAQEAREAFRDLIDHITFEPHAALGAYALTVHSKMAALLSQSGHRAGGNVGCGDPIWSLPPGLFSFAA